MTENTELNDELFEAVQENDCERVSELLEAGADPNARDYAECTPLHRAEYDEHFETVKILMDHGADPNLKCMENAEEGGLGESPLHWFAGMNCFKSLQYIIDHGADINIEDMYGSTALHKACEHGYAETARYLMEKGADFRKKDRFGWTAFHSACSFGSIELIRIFAEEKKLSAGLRTEKMETPFLLSCSSGHLECVEYLLSIGADINEQDKEGNSCILYACQSVCDGASDIVKFFMNRGFSLKVKNLKGFSPVHFAVCTGSLNLVRFLLENGADLNERTLAGETPMYIACTRPGLTSDMLEFLKNKNALFSADFKDGETALHRAVRTGLYELIEHIVRQGSAELKAVNRQGKTALAIAEEMSFTEAAQLLKSAAAE
ncbi:MAG TPA: ankyrin repeat domain-containing protein [Leptospiraceae bacterium]|nr:ankyrin repeat domain-containing protein [Leptospiraceae bacterium]